MDFNEIKNLIQEEGGKIIVVENGKPVMVVLSFEDFKARTLRQGHSAELGRNPQGKQAAQAAGPVFQEEPQSIEEELTIDDLPL